ASNVNNHYKQVTISLTDKVNKRYKINIEIRAFNDGIAIRYFLPKQNAISSFTLLDEQTQFRFVDDPTAKVLLLPNFITSHEGLYTTAALSRIKEDTLIDMPALFKFPGKIFMAITEAALS